ncbi:MAG: hypothetical protein ACI9XC_001002 [Gammaproteobacteria bacterium]|jgi:hypothetical protein
MPVIKPALLLIIVTALTMNFANAQDLTEDERAARREQFQNMTEEERNAERETRRENFQNLTDEERTAAREQRRQQREERFENLSDEQRQVIQERRQERRASGEGFGGREPGRGRDRSPGGGARRGN